MCIGYFTFLFSLWVFPFLFYILSILSRVPMRIKYMALKSIVEDERKYPPPQRVTPLEHLNIAF